VVTRGNGGGTILGSSQAQTFLIGGGVSGVQEIDIPFSGWLTGVSVRVAGVISTTDITAGPVSVDVYLRRGGIHRLLMSGACYGEWFSVVGSGMLDCAGGAQIVIKYTSWSTGGTTLECNAWVDPEVVVGAHPGWHMESEPVVWMNSQRRIAQQTNAGGGAIVVDVTPLAGQSMRVVGLRALYTCAAQNLYVIAYDEDNAEGENWTRITGALANPAANLPSIGTASTATNAVIHSIGRAIAPGGKLAIYGDQVGADNNTLTIAITALVSRPGELAMDVSRSTNPGDVTLAANTVAANMMPVPAKLVGM